MRASQLADLITFLFLVVAALSILGGLLGLLMVALGLEDVFFEDYGKEPRTSGTVYKDQVRAGEPVEPEDVDSW